MQFRSIIIAYIGLALAASLCTATDAHAERLKISDNNPRVIRSDSMKQESLVCYQRPNGKKVLLLIKYDRMLVGLPITSTTLSPAKIKKLRSSVQQKVTTNLHKRASARLTSVIKAQKASLELYKRATQAMSSCQKMSRNSFRPKSLPPPAPALNFAYAEWGNTDPSLLGVITVPRAWIYYSADSSAIAEKLALLPSGHHAILDQCTSQIETAKVLSQDPRDACTDPVTHKSYACYWWDNGVSSIRPRYLAFYKDLVSRGATLDHIAMDMEAGFSIWNVPSGDDYKPFSRAVQSDPRWPSLHAELIDAGMPARATFDQMIDFFHYPYYLIFDDVMQKRQAHYVDQAFGDPARKYFPNVEISNFAYYNATSHFEVPEYNGHKLWLGGSGAIVGTNQGPVAYGSLGSIRNSKLDGENYYQATPFNALRFETNVIRSTVLGMPVNPTDVWIAPRNWWESLYYLDELYQEMMLHTLASGARHLLYWNPRYVSPDGAIGSYDYEADKPVSDTMLEFNDFAGFPDRQTLESGIQGWGDPYVKSCMQANAMRVCRVTTELPYNSGGDTTVAQSGSEVIVHTGKTTLTFSSATLYTSSVAPRGFWVVQPISAPDAAVQTNP